MSRQWTDKDFMQLYSKWRIVKWYAARHAARHSKRALKAAEESTARHWARYLEIQGGE